MLPEAGEIALRWFRSGLEAEDKGGARTATTRSRSPTATSNRRCVRGSRWPIRTTRSSARKRARSGLPGRYRWLIDPIDGTKAFVTGSPLWGTLLGLLDNGRPIAGWIHQPYLEETFVGLAGRGAWMEHRGERRELRTRHGVTLDNAVVYCTTPSMFTDPDELALFDAVRSRARLVRYGGDCYAYAQLAMGHVDMVIDTGLKPYDIVAPMAVIEAAGGVVLGAGGGSASDGGFAVAAGSAELAVEIGSL